MSGKKNIVLELSYKFALATISLCKKMKKRNVEYALINQLLKSGTSVGANLEESVGGISNKDFLNKLFIAYKEARESRYWLNLL